ncbi:MAG: PhzF family phenazine biosynthesis protein [Treponema sp.]|nr:PhzF family phenazine biosynthesis protein [Treponema sp.]
MKYYHIDSFASELFKGNPAGVCILGDSWLSENLMQSIAFEINLSETAFVICKAGEYHIRWFTPTVEVDLCGHATFAAFYVLVNFEGYKEQSISFKSASGELKAYRNNELLTIDLPAVSLKKEKYIWDFDCFDSRPVEVYSGKGEYLFVFEREEQVANVKFDLDKIAKVDSQGIIITAPGNGELDFASRYFAPNLGIPEDPVTGSAHTLLVPYWAERLGKTSLEAAQLSPRGGRLSCVLINGRVHLSGRGAAFMHGLVLIGPNIK